MLDHMISNQKQFGCREVLEASLCERRNTHIKRAYGPTSRWRSSGTVETVGAMDTRREDETESTDGMRNVNLLLKARKQ